jgi:hypothetical protein
MSDVYNHTPDECAILRALGLCPAGDEATRAAHRAVGFDAADDAVPITHAAIAVYLNALRRWLNSTLIDAQQVRTELAELHADLAAVRRVFGVAP